MSDEPKEVMEKLGEIASAVKTAQETADKANGHLDGLDLKKIEAATEAATKGIEEMQIARQEEAAKQEELKQALEDLTLEVAKGGGSGAPDAEEKEYRDSLIGYMRKGIGIGPELVERACRLHAEKTLIGVDENKMDMYTKDLVAGVGPDGGYFITTDRSSKISTRIFETSPLRSVASVQSTASDMFEMVIDDEEATSGWVGETQSRSDTNTPEVGLIKIPIHEQYAQPRATQKMIDDAGFDIESWLSNKVASKLGRDENTSFVVGNGSKKPRGFLTYDDWTTAGTYERGKIEQISSGNASLLTGDGLIRLQNALIQEYDLNATWGMKRSTFGDVMILKDSNGRYLLNPRVLAEGAEKILLGKPVVLMDDMPAVAADALSVVYADFNEFYTIVDRFGIRVLRDPYTAKPYIKFYTTKRVGGDVTNYEAGKIQKVEA
jgi:HK97 family phage major capsid protein